MTTRQNQSEDKTIKVAETQRLKNNSKQQSYVELVVQGRRKRSKEGQKRRVKERNNETKHKVTKTQNKFETWGDAADVEWQKTGGYHRLGGEQGQHSERTEIVTQSY